MTNQLALLDAAPVAAPAFTVGATVLDRHGEVGTVAAIELEAYAAPMLIVEFGARRAVHLFTEVRLAPAHDRARMFTTCACLPCVELRRTAGRMWA